jgi:hypothetical protein
MRAERELYAAFKKNISCNFGRERGLLSFCLSFLLLLRIKKDMQRKRERERERERERAREEEPVR